MCDVVALAKFIFRAAETRRIRYHRRRRDRAAPRRAAPRRALSGSLDFHYDFYNNGRIE